MDYAPIKCLGIDVDVHVKGFDKEGHVIHPGAKVYPRLVHDLSLSFNKVSVLDSSLTTILGSYPTMYAAAKWAKIRQIEVRRYIGTKYLVPTSEGKFYFDTDDATLESIYKKAPNNSKPVDVLDLNTGVLTPYSSVTKASQALSIHHEFITKHMVKKTTFISLDNLRKYKFIVK